MIPIPAIDLKGGKVVRLLHGDFKAETVYAERPADVAREFEAQGARRVHVVDLDGALTGKPANLAGIEAVLKTVKIPVEVGGGIREAKQIERYLEMGVRWVILGTKACLDAGFLKEVLAAFKERVILGVDAKGGKIAVDGWTKITQESAVDFLKKAYGLGARTAICTDIATDGALTGPNLTGLAALCDAAPIDVIASGGVSSVADLKSLKKMGKSNLTGVVIGKALYEKKFTVREAVDACSPNA